MATKKQDTTATTEQEKPRAIMDLISIYDIIGGSYNLGAKLWDYLTQEEQAELLKADKEYKQWRSKTLRETGEETTRKIKLPNDAEGFKDTAKELYYKARGRLWDAIKNDKEKLKKTAAEHIKGLSYTNFSFKQIFLFMDFIQDRDFGSWSYDENREEGERFQRSEASPEELELKRAKLTDYKDLAENVIDEAINKYEARFIEIWDGDTEEALKEWTAYIKPYKDKKVNEWVKEAKKQEKEREKEYKNKSLKEIATSIIQTPIKGENCYITNDKVSNNYTDIENSLLTLDATGQYTFLPYETQKVRVSKEWGDDNKNVYCIVSLQANTEDGKLPRELKDINGYDMAVHRALCTAWREGRRILTVVEIYQIMKNTDARPTKREQDRIIKSLRKFLVRRLELNISQERGKTIRNKKSFDERTESGALRDFIINYRELERYTQRGERIFTIELAFEPILLVYAGMKGQVLKIPKYLYDTGMMRQTEDTICIQEALVKRLWLMKNGSLDNDVIKFESILQEGGIDIKESKREDYQKILKDLLHLYQSKKMNNFITAVEPIREGKAHKITGYKITMQKTLKSNSEGEKPLLQE